MSKNLLRVKFLVLFLLVTATAGYAQDKGKHSDATGTPVLWEKVRIADRDLFWGPGGKESHPDLRSVTFIKEETEGYNKKYRIKDASGREWVAKLGREAQPETAAVRLLWGLGYKTEINYLVPNITIPGKGTFKNVRLEARPDNVKRLDEWQWRSNPFVGTDQLQGLKIMMIFLTNWDLIDKQNKVIRTENGERREYIISDLGATFGRFGWTNIPVFFFYKMGRSTGNPRAWSKAGFIKGVKNGEVRLATTGSKSRDLFNGITVSQVHWLAGLLSQLSDAQIRDAFRAANYSPADIDAFTKATHRRIREVENIDSAARLAGK